MNNSKFKSIFSAFKRIKDDNNRSLKRKVMCVVAIAAVSMIVIFGLIMFGLQKMHLLNAIKKSVTYLDVLIKMEGTDFGNEIFEARKRAIEMRAIDVLTLDGILSITVYDDEYRVITHVDRLIKRNPSVVDGWIDAEAGKVFVKKTMWNGVAAIFYSAPIFVMNECIGHINIFYSLADIEKERRVFYSILTVFLIITFFVFVIIMQNLLGEAIIKPIKRLRKAMTDVEVYGPGNELSVVNPDEIGDLFITFNAMSRQLKDSLTKLQIEISDRKRAEADLDNLQFYLTDVINSMPSSLIVVDRDLVVTQWNTEATVKTGILSSFSVGKKLPDIYPMMECYISKIRGAMADRVVVTEPKIIDENSLGVTYYDMVIYPLVINRTTGAVIMLDDVTERVRLEEMMVQSEKMLSVGGLAAGMAHEINNPLSGMIQSVEVLTRRLTGDDIDGNLKVAEEVGVTIDEIKRYMERRGVFEVLSRLRASGVRISAIVKNMLSFARKNDFVFETVDIEQILDQTIELAGSDYDLKREYDFKTIEIKRIYENSIPLVECEVTKIQQVFLNILRNGAESMQEKKRKNEGNAVFSYKPLFTLDVSFDKIHNTVKIIIEDNGTGIQEENRNKIFEPFFTTKSPGVGTGLGLSVSYFIITKNHGGKMSVDSEYGYGSKFTIVLPINKRPFDFEIEKKL